ncbi:MAG TPA: hypothetical protein VEQ60_24290 [Longimicrobium sp.]|nr:hypothetical protein [Longimicrobium sp.]
MKKMNRLTLNVEELAVDSFETSVSHEALDFSGTTTEVRPCHA